MADTIGRFGYVGPMAEPPINHPVSALSNLNWDWREVPIRDARQLPGGATLKRNGFTTLPHPTAVKNWDGEGWRDQYTREVLEMIKQATGASEAAVTRNSGRSDTPFGVVSSRFDEAEGVRPLAFCHNDFTSGSAPRHLAADYPDRVQALFAKRFAIYNVWHLISPPPQSHPLAVCDATSIAAADLIPADARFGPKDNQGSFGENAQFRFNPAHRWYYYPDLRNDETLVWAGYDSDPSFPSIVPHVSFLDPNCHDPAAERTSVIGSVYAFFD